MRTALAACALLFACASSKDSARDAAASATAAQLPSNAATPAPTPQSASASQPGGPGPAPAPAGLPSPSAARGPLTASEAAAAAAREPHGGGAGDGAAQTASEEGPCASEADCTFTRVGPGACCPMLCAPRAVTKKRGAELEAHLAGCNGGRACPEPMCRPPRERQILACVEGRCVVRAVPSKGEQ
jgi:hypothetical protein